MNINEPTCMKNGTPTALQQLIIIPATPATPATLLFASLGWTLAMAPPQAPRQLMSLRNHQMLRFLKQFPHRWTFVDSTETIPLWSRYNCPFEDQKWPRVQLVWQVRPCAPQRYQGGTHIPKYTKSIAQAVGKLDDLGQKTGETKKTHMFLEDFPPVRQKEGYF